MPSPPPPAGRRRCGVAGAASRSTSSRCVRPPSSSNSSSASRARRMTDASRIVCPGKSCGRCARMMSSSSTNATPSAAAICTSRVRPERHLHDREAVLGFARRGVEEHGDVEAERRQQRKRPRHVDRERRQHRQDGVREERAQRGALCLGRGRRTSAAGCRVRESAGSSSSVTSRYSAATNACARSRDGRELPAGVRPPRSGEVSPSSTACCRPATRTMKNSSRFDAAIAANLTRSSSGMVGSAASSSTRSLNASHDSSRLMNRLLSWACGRRHPTTPAGRMTSPPAEHLDEHVGARGRRHLLHRDVAGAVELQHPGLLAAHEPQVRAPSADARRRARWRRGGWPPAC